ncbi:hypothetical protein DFS34DRAFT_45604 [Phlyctochytrium arcticum]|nr:hypothetical protein DFS34DRAFT_45604 [Phlyctochytrium arcticum]
MVMAMAETGAGTHDPGPPPAASKVTTEPPMGNTKYKVEPQRSMRRRLAQSMNPLDRPWAESQNGHRLILPVSMKHLQDAFRHAKVTPCSGWDELEIRTWDPAIDYAQSKVQVIIPISAHVWTPELAEKLEAIPETKLHRLNRQPLDGRIVTSLSKLQEHILTGDRDDLLGAAQVHFVEWAAPVMCNDSDKGCISENSLRCHGVLVMDEQAEFPQKEVKTAESTVICVAGGPASVSRFVRRGRALKNECYPMGCPHCPDKDAATVLVTDLMTLRLQYVVAAQAGSSNVDELDPEESQASCGFVHAITTCAADSEMSYQEVLDWAGNFQLSQHGIKGGAVISYESIQDELNSMLANRHLATNDSDTEEWSSIGRFVILALFSLFPTVTKRPFHYFYQHILWLNWAMPIPMRILPVFTAALCGGTIAFAITDVHFTVSADTAMWWSAISLIGLTIATYSIGQLILYTFYATTAARLALDSTTIEELLHVRSVRVLSWMGVITMLRVHNTGLASAICGAGVLALGVLSTQVFQVEQLAGTGGISLSAAPTAFGIGAGYAVCLVVALWLASSLRLLCLSNAGARRALFLLYDDISLINAVASSPVLKILEGMCDSTSAELRAALGPRKVQYGSSKLIRPAKSMEILTSDVKKLSNEEALDKIASSQIGHLVLDLEDRVGRAEHGMYS